MRTVEANDPRPAFVQIADDLRARIVGGELGSGMRLPSGRELARQYGVALMTAQNAFQRLKDEGYIYSTGRGYFVGDPQPPGDIAQRLEAVEVEIRKLRSRVESLESSR